MPDLQIGLQPQPPTPGCLLLFLLLPPRFSVLFSVSVTPCPYHSVSLSALLLSPHLAFLRLTHCISSLFSHTDSISSILLSPLLGRSWIKEGLGGPHQLSAFSLLWKRAGEGRVGAAVGKNQRF